MAMGFAELLTGSRLFRGHIFNFDGFVNFMLQTDRKFDLHSRSYSSRWNGHIEEAGIRSRTKPSTSGGALGADTRHKPQCFRIFSITSP